LPSSLQGIGRDLRGSFVRGVRSAGRRFVPPPADRRQGRFVRPGNVVATTPMNFTGIAGELSPP
jgi:hypothetical protein